MRTRVTARDRASTCTGKQAFRSPDIAMRIGKRIRRRSDQRMAAYRCPHCRLWHLGHDDLGRGKLKLFEAQ